VFLAVEAEEVALDFKVGLTKSIQRLDNSESTLSLAVTFETIESNHVWVTPESGHMVITSLRQSLWNDKRSILGWSLHGRNYFD